MNVAALTKRAKIALTALILSLSIFFLPSAHPTKQILLAILVFPVSYVLSLWAIWGPIEKIKLVNLFVLPTIFTLGSSLFFVTVNLEIPARVVLTVLYGVLMYIILLCENIFNVSSVRNIPLLRAATSVGYVATLTVSFLLFGVFYALNLSGFFFASLVLVSSFLLIFQAIWQLDLSDSLSKNVLLYSFMAALITGEFALALSFLPLRIALIAVSLTCVIYVLLGLISLKLREKLTSRSTFEYIFIGGAVFVLILFVTRWGA
ncbi:MAG: hypothetical protein A2Y57_03180 [Candidatus Woykebacteria bacterium RBG_13_40_7b]|uniref:Uncharacterized protein n=1 Tax=Candidatus Woykebacteria bacterium RBG_13_40_7b TaxID=1802594 RepID=A0A1G1W5Y1_9BACT|nr:MAG: hypothetical protein A2Y57_03180 [Candidatus Woykebacteria bacterium RBG_13_40_7b]